MSEDWHGYFAQSSRARAEGSSRPIEVALDQAELPQVRRAQSLIDDLRDDSDGDYFLGRDDPRLAELEQIVDGLTPETPDSESDFERVGS